MNYLTKLNMDQRDIVDQFVSSSVSSICIVAGAGVGKTSTIVAGIINMIKNHRRNPELFFITTFTRNASTELKERLLEYLTPIEVGKMTIGTFHSIALSFYQNNDNSYIEDDIESYLHKFKDHITEFKMKWKYIFIDEYQDINEIQENIIFTLSKNAKKTIVVGDDQQNIYTFRKTNIKYILGFNEKYKSEKRISIRKYLVRNYRCNQSFVGLANIILSYNINKLDKELIAMRKDEESKVLLMCCINQTNQLKDIVEVIRNAYKKNKPLHKIAIISRTNSALKMLELRLAEFNIPSFYIETSRDNVFTQSSIRSINNRVILSTLHGTKGLEFDNVYILDVNEGTFPSPLCTDVEEERRLFYVATTRAMKKLTICYDGHKPSVFITEILKHANCDKYIIQKTQFERDPLIIGTHNKYPQINDLSIENIINGFEFDDYKKFETDIFNYRNMDPEMQQFHKPMTQLFGTYGDRDLLVANTSKLFKNFIETYISRSMQHVCKQNIENIDYIMYVFKSCNDNIESIKNGEVSDLKIVFGLDLIGKTNEELQKYILYYQSGLKLFGHYDKTFKDKFASSYKRYTSDLPSSQVIFDIFIISLVKSLLYDGRSSIMHVINFGMNFKEDMINRGDINEYKKWFKFVEVSISTHFKNIKDVKLSHITFESNSKIKSIINIMYNDTVMIVKPSTNLKPHIASLIQVMTDLAIERKNGNSINKCIIYNPITGCMHKWNLEEWTDDNKLILSMIEKCE